VKNIDHVPDQIAAAVFTSHVADCKSAVPEYAVNHQRFTVDYAQTMLVLNPPFRGVACGRAWLGASSAAADRHPPARLNHPPKQSKNRFLMGDLDHSPG